MVIRARRRPLVDCDEDDMILFVWDNLSLVME